MSVRAAAPPKASPRERSIVVSVLALVRWPNALIASVGVLLGAWWVRAGLVVTRDLALGVAAAWLATAAVNALNDAFDVEIDRVAHPARPLVRGELSRTAAMWIGVGAYVLVGAVARAMSTEAGAVVLGAMVASFAYAFDQVRRGLPGNVLVAVVASLPFLVGAAAAGDAGAGLALVGVAMPLHFAREVMKDLADAAGDAGHRRTVALVWGAGAARGLAAAGVIAYAALVTFLFTSAGAWRLALAPSVAVAAWGVAGPASRAPMLLKLSMLLAMAALPLLR